MNAYQTWRYEVATQEATDFLTKLWKQRKHLKPATKELREAAIQARVEILVGISHEPTGNLAKEIAAEAAANK